MGFSADEALLPGNARSFRGYRLLCEQFGIDPARAVLFNGDTVGMWLADMGADVIKVESPGQGDYLRDMAGETLRSLDANGRIEMSVDVEAGIILPLTQAVPLALVVSELVTNAVKYAFAGREKGHLSVTLRCNPKSARIGVADDGVGLPEGFDPKRSGGLGMKIVTSLVRQVRGELTLENAEPGTRALIEVPLATLSTEGTQA